MTTATIEHAGDNVDHAPWNSAPVFAQHEKPGSPPGWQGRSTVTDREGIQAHRERIMQALQALNEALQRPLR